MGTWVTGVSIQEETRPLFTKQGFSVWNNVRFNYRGLAEGNRPRRGCRGLPCHPGAPRACADAPGSCVRLPGTGGRSPGRARSAPGSARCARPPKGRHPQQNYSRLKLERAGAQNSSRPPPVFHVHDLEGRLFTRELCSPSQTGSLTAPGGLKCAEFPW